LALLFDYDGTLAPIRPSPSEANLPPATRRALMRLRTNPNLAIGVFSGRALADVREMVGIDGVYWSGTSGLEIDLLGQVVTPPGINAARAPLDQIAGRLADVAARYPGAWLEQKPFGLTLHYRAVPAEATPRIRLDALEAIKPWAAKLRIEDVTLGLEITPNVGWDKGTAVRAVLDDLGNEAFPVYAGDSANDAPALAAVDEAGGLSIGIGTTIQGTSTWLHGPGELGALTIMLAVALHDTDCLLSATR
jgi:trehalose 6-phosphate phosphatase